MNIRTLVAVFDSTQVRFFEFKEPHGHLDVVMSDVSTGLHHGHHGIESDRPDRGSSGGQHHTHESQHDPHKLEKHDFVRAVAHAIDRALGPSSFERLVIVAPHRSVGEFRTLASPKVLKALWREVPKELANLTDPQIREHLLPELRPAIA